MIIIDPPATLRAFLIARSRGASEEELKALQIADEAARANNQHKARSRVGAKLRIGEVIDIDHVRRSREQKGIIEN